MFDRPNTIQLPLETVKGRAYQQACTNNVPYRIKEAGIQGQEMRLSITYYGSRVHQFRMLWEGHYLDSIPPQVIFCLEDLDMDDNGECYFEGHFTVDLAHLKKGIKINLHQWGWRISYGLSRQPLVAVNS